MTTTARYKFVENTLGAAFTLANFPYSNDGDDKPFKVIKRAVVAADVGTGAGQLGHASGAIIDVIPATTNVLWALGFVSRPLAAVGGMTPYKNMQGVTVPVVTPLTQMQLQIGLGTDNTIRGIDGNASAGTSAIATGDIITILLFTGSPIDPSDAMNG